jgi:hypothetical protein
MVSVEEENVPPLTQCSAFSNSELALPIETIDSNLHTINASEIRVGYDGYIYALSPCVFHDEHVEINGNGWCTFYKNTAIQSFSQQGVD